MYAIYMESDYSGKYAWRSLGCESPMLRACRELAPGRTRKQKRLMQAGQEQDRLDLLYSYR
jgi:hypothetical protein